MFTFSTFGYQWRNEQADIKNTSSRAIARSSAQRCFCVHMHLDKNGSSLFVAWWGSFLACILGLVQEVSLLLSSTHFLKHVYVRRWVLVPSVINMYLHINYYEFVHFCGLGLMWSLPFIANVSNIWMNLLKYLKKNWICHCSEII